MSSLDAQLAALQATVEVGQREVARRFDAVDRRLDVQDAKLASIESEVKATNGRVTRHDEQIKGMAATVPKGAVTKGAVKDFAAFGGWIVAAVLGLLRLMGKL